jgi:predicted methyltransferase
MTLGSSRADASHARARDRQPMEVLAMAHLGNGWVSCSMRSGRSTYQKVVVPTTNPDHLIPSAGTPSDKPSLRVALRYREGRCR